MRSIARALALLLLAAAPAAAQNAGFARPAYRAIQDEGGALTPRSTLNCVGVGITCADDPSGRRTTVTVNAGAGGVTNIATGNGLSGGPISNTGTINLNLYASGGLSSILGVGSVQLGIATGGVVASMLANTAVTPASYGDASHSTTFTVDAQGRLTAAGTTPIAIAESAITSLVTDLGNRVLTSTQVIAGSGLSGGGALSGDVTLTLPAVGPGAATYGSAPNFLQTITLDAKGRVTAVATGTVSAQGIGVYGDGSDGAQTFDGSATILGFAPAAGVYTITRDLFLADGSTINTGVVVNVYGQKVFCNGNLTVNGTLNASGVAAIGTARSVDQGQNGTLAGLTISGGNGIANSAGGAGTGIGTAGFGGTGGTGGSSSGGPGTGGGTAANAVVAPTGAMNRPHALPSAILGYTETTTGFGTTTPFFGGGGGSGGSAGATSTGGGGGNGGVVIMVSTQTLTLGSAGLIQAIGGNGGNATGSNAGGGGGGGGGLVVLVYHTLVDSNNRISTSNCVAGGSGGSAVGTGKTGAAGGTGLLVQVVN